MQLEFHQLDRRLESLRVRHPARQRRLIASLAENGQQTPILVIATGDRYLVIDGHKRVVALQQLGRDTVEAVVWELGEAEALVLNRTLRMSEPDSAPWWRLCPNRCSSWCAKARSPRPWPCVT
jgi:ParB family transcriptional regulator, chromosome partitioning protein